MISKEEFLSECDKIIPHEEMERYKKCQKRKWLLLLIILPIEVVVWFMLGFRIKTGWAGVGILLLVMIVTLVIILVATKFHWKDFKGKYGKQVLEILLKDQPFGFEPKMSLNSNFLSNSGFCGNFENCSGEDFFKINIPKDDGTPSNVDFIMSDLHATRTETRTVVETDSNGRTTTRTETYTVTVYSGMLGYVCFPFKFKCNLSLNSLYPVGDKIQLEDIKFNKAFRVYTDNQIEALVILTPTIMEKLKALNGRLHNLKLSLTQKGELYVGAGDNMFEIKKKAKPTGKAFEYFYDDLFDIMAIINEIKDNNKLFKM